MEILVVYQQRNFGEVEPADGWSKIHVQSGMILKKTSLSQDPKGGLPFLLGIYPICLGLNRLNPSIRP